MSKLKGKQKKLDVDNDGDIDGHDFKHLREKKSKKGKDVFEKAWDIVKKEEQKDDAYWEKLYDEQPERFDEDGIYHPEEEPAKCHLCNKGYLFSGDKQEPDEENFWVCSDCGTHFGEGY